MRLVRIGAEDASGISPDVRAALVSWGVGSQVVGGVALLNCQPPDCPQPVDAVVVLPRGVLVVVGVELPDPAMRLDAPLAQQWKIDGWPLVRPDGAINPATEALAAASAVTRRLEWTRAEPLPVSTVVAVGPYVSQVVQPTADLNRGVRVLHPESATMLAAARELAVHQRPCTVEQVRGLLNALAPALPEQTTAMLTGEGFADVVSADMAGASTTLIPRITEGADHTRHPVPVRAGGVAHTPMRWLPIGAAVLVGLLLVAGIVAAVASAGNDGAHAGPTSSTSARPASAVIDGLTFTEYGTAQDTDCATHSFGDVQVWLSGHPCTSLLRAGYETAVDGKRAAVAVAVVTFADEQAAGLFLNVVNTPGSGGITDLAKDGSGWQGGPKSFDGAAFSSTSSGSQVRLVEVVWIGSASTPEDNGLRTLAGQALRLPLPD